MSNLLREYIKQCLFVQQLNEAKKETQELALLSNQIIGFSAEWAVYAALGGRASLSDMHSDPRIAEHYNNSEPKAQALFNKIYGKLKAAAQSSKLNELGTTAGEEPPGSSTRPVDVEASLADIHVKYNDDKRLAGFQRAKSEDEDEEIDVESTEPKELSGTDTARIFDASLDQYLQEIIEDAQNILEQDPTASKAIKTLVNPKYREKYYATGVLRGRKRAKKAGESAEFEKVKEAYARVVKLGAGRQRFLEILEENGIKIAILKDINKQIFKSGAAGSTVFAKFTGGPEVKNEMGLMTLLKDPSAYSVTCKYYNYKDMLKLKNPLKDLTVVEVPPRGYAPEIKAAIGAAIEKAAVEGDEEEQEVLAKQPGVVVEGQTTTYYLVVNKKTPDMIYFMIEFRLDGDGHPPQLKTGPALRSLAKVKK